MNFGHCIWEYVLFVRQDVAERAITVKQLRSLRAFLQYLTKTELLKKPGFKLKDPSTCGKLGLWWEAVIDTSRRL